MDSFRLDTAGAFEPHDRTEWLVTNGIGGYASSTVPLCNARRYHALLCAATHPPVGRMVMLNRLGEQVTLDSQASHPHDISVSRFNDLHFPRGDQYLRSFHRDDTPHWTYQVDHAAIERQLLLCWQRNAVAIQYRITRGQHQRVSLSLSPFVSMRDFHGVRRSEHGAPRVEHHDHRLLLTLGEHRLWLWADGARFAEHHGWWFGHTYVMEQERGMACEEDLFCPGQFTLDLDGDGELTLWAVAENDPAGLDFEAELARRREAFAYADRQPTPKLQRLARAAGDFVVQRQTPDREAARSIHAGYPWFSDWGRDAMIALPGLLLETGRLTEAGDVLRLFGQYVSQGMVPNRFDDYDSHPHYNTVDASLWFIHACFAFRDAGGDAKLFANLLLPACRDIVAGYRGGTRFHIRMDPVDTLITQGDAHSQLTWMDAKHGAQVFTPRHGKAVEINALWYHALRLLEENDLADRVQAGFISAFWINPFRGLADVVRDGGAQRWRDTAIRPNQIFAVSLPHSPLSLDQQRAVVEVVRRELLTPMGLRTLSAHDPGYRGRFQGGPVERDSAYHNGTVWPWLIGAFLEAYLRVEDSTPAARKQAAEWLSPLLQTLDTGCIDHLAEVYDGDEPRRPGGCCAQAWSLAETLRIARRLNL